MIFAPLGFAGKIWVGSLLLILFLWGIIYGAGLWNSFLRKTSAPPAKEDAITPEIPIQRKETRQESQKPRVSRTLLDTPSKPVPVTHTESIREEQEVDVEMKPRDERLPALTILSNEETNRPDERTINQTAGQIVRTLAEFGIPAEVIGYRIGPTVTQFAVRPGFIEKEKGQGEGEYQRLKVRVAQISSLEKDLSLSLSAERLRIEAPVPGRPYIGIEVPNNRTMSVRLRPVLESKIYEKLSSLPLAIALGKDVSGQPVVADLAKMPHLLIAGTTGSGKSVCIASIAVCLAMNNLPDSLRMVMIDPKMVELQRFKGLPHILGKVEIELDRILVVLRWIVAEMDRRYKLLEAAHARNIDSYNRKISQRKGEIALPRIVVFIDELADLMMSAPEETEHNLVRLAQMARAVGIHLVVATQRPSTEVVTGLIKANFPARIAFNVASSVDSRVILDTVGAEHLLGRGDMLFLPPDAPAPMRLQGVIITDQEIERLITFWIKHTTLATDSTSPPWEIMMEQEVLSDRDELIDKAIEILRGSKRASTSMLQRRLRIGFPRAARLMEELEEMGVVGPAQSAGRDREVLLE
jgi:S-DNA-T family DNA segregation ATPase FtsK/SpoIIIE